MRRWSFRAMGTSVRILTEAGTDVPFSSAVRAIVRTFERGERRFSRFRGDSELSLVNAAEGRWVPTRPPSVR